MANEEMPWYKYTKAKAQSASKDELDFLESVYQKDIDKLTEQIRAIQDLKNEKHPKTN